MKFKSCLVLWLGKKPKDINSIDFHRGLRPLANLKRGYKIKERGKDLIIYIEIFILFLMFMGGPDPPGVTVMG